MMQTYGMHELTGWMPCKNCDHKLEHPFGELFYENSTLKAISRSLLKYKYKWKVDNKKTGKVSKYTNSATIVLSPEVTKPAQYNYLKLRVRLNEDISVVHPELAMLNGASNLGCQRISLQLQERSPFSTSANLIATILNSGEVNTVNFMVTSGN